LAIAGQVGTVQVLIRLRSATTLTDWVTVNAVSAFHGTSKYFCATGREAFMPQARGTNLCKEFPRGNGLTFDNVSYQT
jgi:uncharacterized membrane protein